MLFVRRIPDSQAADCLSKTLTKKQCDREADINFCLEAVLAVRCQALERRTAGLDDVAKPCVSLCALVNRMQRAQQPLSEDMAF